MEATADSADHRGVTSLEQNRPRVLCVDDDPNVLEGLRDTLYPSFSVATASSGSDAIEMLRQDKSFAIVLADMRMPVMNGAVFLSFARREAPDAVRMLLTGHTDVDAAIDAVNQGEIFRFLTKPCDRDTLLRAFVSAMRQHRLLTAERALLHETVTGTVSVLTEVLALAKPKAFRRATRVKQYASELAAAVDAPDAHEIEVAAMLADIAWATLPPDAADRYYHGDPLSDDELARVDYLPSASARLLRHLPRLEHVCQILKTRELPVSSPDGEEEHDVPLGARILKIAHDFDLLELQNVPPEIALAIMRGRTRTYDRTLLETFSTLRGSTSNDVVTHVAAQELEPGMVLVDDLRSTAGAVVVTRGQAVTPALVDRLAAAAPGYLSDPVQVLLSGDGPDARV
jgi:response regulator RpfG family c-di-GMP phosphodiesterase